TSPSWAARWSPCPTRPPAPPPRSPPPPTSPNGRCQAPNVGSAFSGSAPVGQHGAVDHTADLPTRTRELRSTVNDDATVTVALGEAPVAPPGDDQVVVRVQAAPINPSDMGNLFARADLTRA